MTYRSRYAVACLAGSGVGPELMAVASRALAEVSRLHGFVVDEVHAPFGGEALTRSGHRLPPATRSAAREADAVLVAFASEPALNGVKAELDVAATVTRVRVLPSGELTVFSPAAHGDEDWAIERAFLAACGRHGRLTSIGTDQAWSDRVARVAEGHAGVYVKHLSLAEALPVLGEDPAALGVVVTEQVLAEAVASVPTGRRVMATGLLARTGPSLFHPVHGSGSSIAGQGVANPSGLLLAVSLLLEEGFGRHSAAATLERTVASVLKSRLRTTDEAGAGTSATTREYADVVLQLLPASREDFEFAIGAAS
jgi:3-isopropylmalate dehydrogenase